MRLVALQDKTVTLSFMDTQAQGVQGTDMHLERVYRHAVERRTIPNYLRALDQADSAVIRAMQVHAFTWEKSSMVRHGPERDLKRNNEDQYRLPPSRGQNSARDIIAELVDEQRVGKPNDPLQAPREAQTLREVTDPGVQCESKILRGD